METNADPILITVGGMKNLPYRGWGGGHFQNISDHRSGFVSNLPVVFHPSCCGLTRISKKGVITQKDYRG